MTKRELYQDPAPQPPEQATFPAQGQPDQAHGRQPILGPFVVLGLGLGGFFDGIVLHQILQWHHMLTSAGYPPDSVENLRINTLADGLFHAATYALIIAGLIWLWWQARRPARYWRSSSLFGGLLLGWASFNLVEGLINHQLLGIHHVNETVAPSQQIAWDWGFLALSLAMFLAGWALALRVGGEQGSVASR